MNILRIAHRLLHREHLIWTMDVKTNVVIMVISALLFFRNASMYVGVGNRIYAGFLLGIAVGMFFGAYWHYAFSHNWNFYRKFYSAKTKAKERFKMLGKKIDHELPTYITSVLFGFVLVYLSINSFVWLASALFFGFIFGGSLALILVLKDLF